MKKNILISLLVVIIIMLGLVTWKNSVHPEQNIQQIPVQNTQPVAVDNSNISNTPTVVPANLNDYKNTELHFAFSYPKEWGNEKDYWNTGARIGEIFGGFVGISSTGYGIRLIASSPNYKDLGPGHGGSWYANATSVDFYASNDYETVTDITSNGISGKFIAPTSKCVEMCEFGYRVVFPLQNNDKGLKVMGFESFKISKEDFLKIISTFKQI